MTETSFWLSRGSTEGLLRRPGLEDKAPARIVVGGVGAEEALEALYELLAAVCLEWLEALVVCASAPFVLEARPMQSIARDSLCECRAREPGSPRRPRPGPRSSSPMLAAWRAPTGLNGGCVRRAVIVAPTRRGSR